MLTVYTLPTRYRKIIEREIRITGVVGVIALLTACNAPVNNEPLDSRTATLRIRAESLLSKYTGEEEVEAPSIDVSDVMCPDIEKMWLPVTNTDVGGVFFIVPGQELPGGNVPKIYMIGAGFKSFGSWNLGVDVNYDKVHDTCDAAIIKSGM